MPPNFILASAEKLPFVSNSFSVVRSSYVIEHLVNPAFMIEEHLRVAQNKVEIYTDNSDWLGMIFMRLFKKGSIFHEEHYYKWSKEYLDNLISRLGYSGEVGWEDYSHALLSKMFSMLGFLPGFKPMFFRDLKAVIYK